MGESQTYSQSATQPCQSSGEIVSEDVAPANDLCDYWARLYPARPDVKCRDLVTDKISVGKLKSCDICLKVDEGSTTSWELIHKGISRQHFTIMRNRVERFGSEVTEVQLKDHSMNGTYINGSVVGKGNVKTLLDNSVISVGKPQNEIFYYKEALANNSKYPKSLQQKYDISILLGTGAFGEVTLVFSKETCKGYAMKTILKDTKATKKKINIELEKLENEVKILQRIKHPNVIQLVDSISTRSQKYIFLELMHGKDLFTCISTSIRLTESQAKLYFYQIASGVQYLHQNEIIHRDLKPENVLLATNEVETVLKITDFGLSKMLHPETFLRSLCGTKMYVAPEVLESGGSRAYTGQVDVWSMGVILYVCLSGQTPFIAVRNGMTMDEQIRNGCYTLPPSKWEGVSNPAKRIVQHMMTLDPERRISITDIFQHPWLQDPPMKAKVECLLRANVLPEEQSCFPIGKENVPEAGSQERKSEGIQSECTAFPLSPVPASFMVMSPPLPPPRKRRRVKCDL